MEMKKIKADDVIAFLRSSDRVHTPESVAHYFNINVKSVNAMVARIRKDEVAVNKIAFKTNKNDEPVYR